MDYESVVEEGRLEHNYQQIPMEIQQTLHYSAMENLTLDETLDALTSFNEADDDQHPIKLWINDFENIVMLVEVYIRGKHLTSNVKINKMNSLPPTDPNYGGLLTLMNTLDVGDTFHVKNGDWKGKIIEVNDGKMIYVDETKMQFPPGDSLYYI